MKPVRCRRKAPPSYPINALPTEHFIGDQREQTTSRLMTSQTGSPHQAHDQDSK